MKVHVHVHVGAQGGQEIRSVRGVKIIRQTNKQIRLKQNKISKTTKSVNKENKLKLVIPFVYVETMWIRPIFSLMRWTDPLQTLPNGSMPCKITSEIYCVNWGTSEGIHSYMYTCASCCLRIKIMNLTTDLWKFQLKLCCVIKTLLQNSSPIMVLRDQTLQGLIRKLWECTSRVGTFTRLHFFKFKKCVNKSYIKTKKWNLPFPWFFVQSFISLKVRPVGLLIYYINSQEVIDTFKQTKIVTRNFWGCCVTMDMGLNELQCTCTWMHNNNNAYRCSNAHNNQ